MFNKIAFYIFFPSSNTSIDVPRGHGPVVAGRVQAAAVQRQARDGLVVSRQHPERRVRAGRVQVRDVPGQGHGQQVLALPQAGYLGG